MLADIAPFCPVPLRAEAGHAPQPRYVARAPLSASIPPIFTNSLAAAQPRMPESPGALALRGTGMVIENIPVAAAQVQEPRR
jgi:hypothetical protein